MTYNSVTYKFRMWSLKIHVDALDTTNFDSAGDARENIDGLKGAQLSLEGPYDQGVMAFTAGAAYAFTLNAGTSTFAVTARITDITPNVQVDGVVTVQIEATVTGNFTAAIA